MCTLKNRKTKWIIFALLAGVLIGACAPTTPVEDADSAAPITLTDARGVEISFNGPPQRIISMAPSNTEMLFAIGAGSQLIGRDDVSDYPPEALEIESIGSTYGELNSEAILALNPDLILAADLTPPEQIETLENLDLVVFQVRNPAKFSDLFEILGDLGRMTGHTQEADTLAAQLRERTEKVSSTVADADRVPVFYEVDGSDPAAPWTTGSATFQDVLIQMAGGENVASALEGWGQLSIEEIVTRDPHVIFYAAGPWVPTTIESLSARAGWSDIRAVVDGNVVAIDTNWVDRPGPRLVDALEAMAKSIHPELFE
jgi:iron complex transport system substrate-binding protein